MPIEIRELVIKVKVTNEPSSLDVKQGAPIFMAQLNALKAEIIKECTVKVIEKIKENEER